MSSNDIAAVLAITNGTVCSPVRMASRAQPKQLIIQ